MIACDAHMHTRFSEDSDASVHSMLDAAMNKGMQVIYESMRVKCAKLFLVGFFFLFFLRDAESCIKFEYGGNCKTSNPFVTTCCEHECSGENQG